MHPISEVLCSLYNSLYEKGAVSFPLQEIHRQGLDSTVKTVDGTWFGKAAFPELEDQAAAYFVLIIKDHNVVDGNKRLAVIMLDFFCFALNLEMKLPDDLTLDVLAVSVEKSGIETRELINDVRTILFGQI